MTSRAPRFLRAMEFYLKHNSERFDSRTVLSKVNHLPSSDGVSRTSFIVDKSLCNGADTLHGGFITACTDTMATFTHIHDTGMLAWTMNLNIDLISRAVLGDQVTVETSAIRTGRNPIMETRFIKDDGTLIAKGTTSLLLAHTPISTLHGCKRKAEELIVYSKRFKLF